MGSVAAMEAWLREEVDGDDVRMMMRKLRLVLAGSVMA